MFRSLFILIVLVIGSATLSFGQASKVDTRAKFKSIFIFGFTKNIEWPEDYRQGEFVIGVLGESSLFSSLSTAAQTKKVNGQTVKVVKFNSASEITKCHILYISSDFKDVGTAIKKLSSNTLVITEGANLVEQYSGINFVVISNQLKFEMNKRNIEKYGLTIGANLTKLAAKVIE